MAKNVKKRVIFLKEKVLIVNLICNVLENLLMTAGIIYSAVIFKKIGILWFLFLPVANSVTIRFSGNNNETDDSEGEGE